MSSDRQLQANRINARKSTGPRTAIGKARVSSNGLKHGLTGRAVVLPSENRRDYDDFRANLIDALDPHGALEDVLADKIVADAWRIRRVPILEAALFRRGRHDLAIDQAQAAVGQFRSAEIAAMVSAASALFKRSEAREEAQRKLNQAQSEKQNLFLLDPVLHASQVLEVSIVTLANLWRQERSLVTSMRRTLHELQRLQAARTGEFVPAPAVLDVNLGAGPAHLQGFGDD